MEPAAVPHGYGWIWMCAWIIHLPHYSPCLHTHVPHRLHPRTSPPMPTYLTAYTLVPHRLRPHTSPPPPSYLTAYAHIPHPRTSPPTPTYLTAYAHVPHHLRLRTLPTYVTRVRHCPTYLYPRTSSPPPTYLTASTPPPPHILLCSNITLHVSCEDDFASIFHRDCRDKGWVQDFERLGYQTLQLSHGDSSVLTENTEKFAPSTYTTNLGRHKPSRRSPKGGCTLEHYRNRRWGEGAGGRD